MLVQKPRPSGGAFLLSVAAFRCGMDAALTRLIRQSLNGPVSPHHNSIAAEATDITGATNAHAETIEPGPQA